MFFNASRIGERAEQIKNCTHQSFAGRRQRASWPDGDAARTGIQCRSHSNISRQPLWGPQGYNRERPKHPKSLTCSLRHDCHAWPRERHRPRRKQNRSRRDIERAMAIATCPNNIHCIIWSLHGVHHAAHRHPRLLESSACVSPFLRNP